MAGQGRKPAAKAPAPANTERDPLDPSEAPASPQPFHSQNPHPGRSQPSFCGAEDPSVQSTAATNVLSSSTTEGPAPAAQAAENKSRAPNLHKDVEGRSGVRGKRGEAIEASDQSNPGGAQRSAPAVSWQIEAARGKRPAPAQDGAARSQSTVGNPQAQPMQHASRGKDIGNMQTGPRALSASFKACREDPSAALTAPNRHLDAKSAPLQRPQPLIAMPLPPLPDFTASHASSAPSPRQDALRMEALYVAMDLSAAFADRAPNGMDALNELEIQQMSGAHESTRTDVSVAASRHGAPQMEAMPEGHVALAGPQAQDSALPFSSDRAASIAAVHALPRQSSRWHSGTHRPSEACSVHFTAHEPAYLSRSDGHTDDVSRADGWVLKKQEPSEALYASKCPGNQNGADRIGAQEDCSTAEGSSPNETCTDRHMQMPESEAAAFDMATSMGSAKAVALSPQPKSSADAAIEHAIYGRAHSRAAKTSLHASGAPAAVDELIGMPAVRSSLHEAVKEASSVHGSSTGHAPAPVPIAVPVGEPSVVLVPAARSAVDTQQDEHNSQDAQARAHVNMSGGAQRPPQGQGQAGDGAADESPAKQVLTV